MRQDCKHNFLPHAIMGIRRRASWRSDGKQSETQKIFLKRVFKKTLVQVLKKLN